MAVKRQIRYIKDGDQRNYPPGLTRDQLIAGDFLPPNTKISELKITGIPGLGFYLNDTPSCLRLINRVANESNQTIRIDPNNVDHILKLATYDSPKDLNNIEIVLSHATVYSIKFEAESIDRLNAYNNLSTVNTSHTQKWLIIDYVTE